MKTTLTAAMALALAFTGLQAASAQPGRDKHDGQYNQQQNNGRDNNPHDNGRHDNGLHNGWVQHSEWRKGSRMRQEDWRRGQRIDYRSHHLRAPPRGYEWREVDGNYVLAAVATGLIASLIMGSH